ncbi:MAG TPA: M24 family metallopeptidase [Gemmataceae bacterium]|jgi:Xaa-Pro aminopeptidase|nr:M24 family metallopeptidase [Gemmataceae bacterium]
MSLPAESLVRPAASASELNLDIGSDRRADIDAKQSKIAALIQEVGCDGLLVTELENFFWLTSGATPRGILDPDDLPALYFNSEQRWLICSNVDSQRLFDEELDGLGFQLKEWPWHWGREQLLADLTRGRRVATDRPRGDAPVVAEQLRRLRLSLTPYEQACYRALGQILSHALEATARTMLPNETEREVAGQIGHRLLHRGVQPLVIGVAADGRSRLYRQFGFTSTPVRKYCVLSATARKYGLCATASRSVCFGPPDPALRKEHDTTCKVSATYLASTWPDAVPREILAAGRRVYLVTGFEHEWLLVPQGHLTGRRPVERTLLPETEELFQPGWAVTWRASAGAALSCDTFLIGDDGPKNITPTEVWPLKRIRIQGAEFVRPDLLIRES